MIYIVHAKRRKHLFFFFFSKQMVQRNQECRWTTAENVFLLRRENAAGMKLQAHKSDNNNKKPQLCLLAVNISHLCNIQENLCGHPRLRYRCVFVIISPKRVGRFNTKCIGVLFLQHISSGICTRTDQYTARRISI